MTREIKLLEEVTRKTIGYARWLLVSLSLLAGLGLFHTFMWYATWDHARIAGREAVLETLQKPTTPPLAKPGQEKLDKEIEALKAEVQRLEKERVDRRAGLPVLGIDVSISDFPVGVLILGNTLLVLLVL